LNKKWGIPSGGKQPVVELQPLPPAEAMDAADAAAEEEVYTIKSNVALNDLERDIDMATWQKLALGNLRKHCHGIEWKPEFELSGSADPNTQKYASFFLHLKINRRTPDVPFVFGFYPVSMGLTLRRGIVTKGNETLLRLSPRAFRKLIEQGKLLIHEVLGWLGEDYVGVANLPKFTKIVLEGNGKTATMLTVSLLPNGSNQHQLAPIINVREYYSSATAGMLPGKKGISLGLRAFMNLVHPAHDIVKTLHESLKGIRETFDKYEDFTDATLKDLEQAKSKKDAEVANEGVEVVEEEVEEEEDGDDEGEKTSGDEGDELEIVNIDGEGDEDLF
jgi:hypothetical protein